MVFKYYFAQICKKKLYSFLRWFYFRILKNVMFLLKKDILKDFFFTIPAQIFLTRIILNLNCTWKEEKIIV